MRLPSALACFIAHTSPFLGVILKELVSAIVSRPSEVDLDAILSRRSSTIVSSISCRLTGRALVSTALTIFF